MSIKSILTVLMIALSISHAWADKTAMEAIKTYHLYGASVSAADLETIKANVAAASSQSFDRCMARGASRGYWDCYKHWVTGESPWPFNKGFINGEPISTRLHLDIYRDNKSWDGHHQSTSEGSLLVRVGFRCPSELGFITVGDGPREDRTLWCERVEVESCSTGNPLDVYSGKKYEFNVDYASPNGALKVERQYVNQHSGWIVNAEPRIKYVGASEAIPTEGLFPHTRAACVAPIEQVLTRYKATYDEPSFTERYTNLVCLKLLNRETSPVIHAWLSGNEYRFLKNGDVYRPEGGFEGRLKIETVSGSTVPGAVWKMTHSDGALSYFNNEGIILKTFMAAGGYLDYQYLNGQLAKKSDQSGRSISYIYNEKQRLESILLPGDGVIQYDYASNDNEEDINYWLLTKVTWPDGASEEYTYNESEHILGKSTDSFLTGKIDAYGNRIGTYKYTIGRAILTEGFEGVDKAEITYRRSSYLRLKDSLGTDRILYFQTRLADGKRLLTREMQPAGAGSTAANRSIYYNSDGQITEKRDFNSNKIQYAYDPVLKFRTVEVNGIPAAQSGIFTAEGASLPPGATKTTTQWNATVSKPALIAAPAKLTTIIYQGIPDPFNNNEVANCTAASLGNGPLPVICRVVEQATTDTNGQLGFSAILDVNTETRHVLYTYDDNGNLLTAKRSPDFTNEITVEYYLDTTSTHRMGDIKKTQNVLGHSIDYLEYDAHGNPTKIQDANGVLTLMTYDARGRLESQSVAGQTIMFSYNLNGNLASITSPDGRTLTREYDGAGRLSAVVDELLNRYEYRYDLASNLLSKTIKDSAAQTLFSTSNQYDALGRLQKTFGNNGQSNELTYDKNGNLLTDSNALGNTTISTIDALNRVSEITDANNGKTKYAYDSYDRIISATDAEGKATRYNYDAFGNLTTLTSEDTGMTTFTYDEVGNVLSKTDARGVTVTYAYDALNRITDITYSNAAENVTYSYDETTNGNMGIGRLTSATDPSGTTQYEYNALGEITTMTQVINSQTYVTEYLFDTSGRASGVIYPSGASISYSYDNLGQISGVDAVIDDQMQSLASAISYLPFGPMKSLTFGNGALLTNSYDLDYRLTDASVASLRQNSYIYSLNNNITAIEDAYTPQSNQGFVYDVLDRLDIADGDYGIFDYDYDGVGNRLSKNADTYIYENSSKLQTIFGSETLAFDYDANGNTLQKGNLAFTYNQANRLASATDGTFSASYTYNIRGERVIKIVDGIETHFIFDLSGKLIAEADANGNIFREYAYFNDAPLAQIVDSDIYYYHNSHLGTPESMTDSAQAVVWSSSYTPFGMGSVITGVVENNLRFPGQYYDEETGLHYNYFRYYDPATGRYITSDPIGLAGGLNTYSYVENNPLNYIDPYGLNPVAGAIGGGTIAGPPGAVIGGVIGFGIGLYLGDRMFNEDGSSDGDYPANPDNWNPPDGWVETPAGEKTGGKHRQWKGPDGKWRRWDREGRKGGKDRGSHWHDSDRPGEHIDPDQCK